MGNGILSLVIIFIVFVWLAGVTFLLVRILKTFTNLTKGVSDKDLKSILDEILKLLKQEEVLGKNLKKEIEDLQLEGTSHLQKIGLVRYNPFSETGGNQSFVLAILNSKTDGFVITSLHSRDSTRVFAKPVRAGKEAGFEFSKEEIQAIIEAQKKKVT